MAEKLTGNSDGSWNCIMCTFSNSAGAKSCSMCDTKRQPNPSAPPVFSRTKKDEPDSKRQPTPTAPPVFSLTKKDEPTPIAPSVFSLTKKDEPTSFGGPKVFDIDKALDELDGAGVSIETDSDKVKANGDKRADNGAVEKHQGGKNPIVAGNSKSNGKGIVPNNVDRNEKVKEGNGAKIKTKESGTKSKDTENKKSPVKHKCDDRKEEGMELDLQWVCPKCSSLNQEYFQNCIICNTEKSIDVLEFVQDYWSDKRSNTNQPDEKIVKVDDSKRNKTDGKEKVRKEESKHKGTKEWSCKHCTLKNPMTATKCAVCEAPRLSNIPSADSIPDELDYSKFTPSPTSPSSHRGIPDGNENDKKKLDSNEVDGKVNVVKTVAVWKCPKCSFAKNSQKTEKCTACGEGRKPREVKTGDSTQTNSDESSKVNKLPVISKENGKKSPRVSLVPSPGTSKDGNGDKMQRNKKISSESKEKDMRNQLFWNCQKCSFQNSNATQSCHVCGTSRKALLLENKHKWICSKCTLLNNNDATKCSACGNQKGEVLSKEEPLTIDSEPQPSTSKFEPKPSTSGAKSPKSPRPRVASPIKTDCDPASRCSICTYINPYTSGPCKMCGSALTNQHDMVVSPGTIRPKHTLKRQQSSLMNELRQVEENEAVELWQHITLFCKQVRWFPFTQIAVWIID